MKFAEYIKKLTDYQKKLKEEAVRRIEEVVEDARVEAIKTAVDNTPPSVPAGKMRGKNTITGALQRSWKTDSSEIKRDGKLKWKFNLRNLAHTKNGMHYASYVNDGHNLEKHYVPGLYVNPYTNLIEYDEDKVDELGMMVGTKTDYVEGYHMVEKANRTWLTYLMKNLARRVLHG